MTTENQIEIGEAVDLCHDHFVTGSPFFKSSASKKTLAEAIIAIGSGSNSDRAWDFLRSGYKEKHNFPGFQMIFNHYAQSFIDAIFAGTADEWVQVTDDDIKEKRKQLKIAEGNVLIFVEEQGKSQRFTERCKADIAAEFPKVTMHVGKDFSDVKSKLREHFYNAVILGGKAFEALPSLSSLLSLRSFVTAIREGSLPGMLENNAHTAIIEVGEAMGQLLTAHAGDKQLIQADVTIHPNEPHFTKILTSVIGSNLKCEF